MVKMDLWRLFLVVSTLVQHRLQSWTREAQATSPSTNSYAKFLRACSCCNCSWARTLLSNSQSLPFFSSPLAKKITLIYSYTITLPAKCSNRVPNILLPFWSIRWQMLLDIFMMQMSGKSYAWEPCLWDAHHVWHGSQMTHQLVIIMGTVVQNMSMSGSWNTINCWLNM